MNKELEIVKKIINEEMEKEGITVEKIILFGSRARGESCKESDWDLLVVINKKVDRKQRWKIIINIKRRLVLFSISNDIIIEYSKQIAERQNNVGHITYYALKEGIVI